MPAAPLPDEVEAMLARPNHAVIASSRPDGQPSRYLDVSRARELIGFEAQVGLAEGLEETVRAYRADPVPAQ